MNSLIELIRSLSTYTTNHITLNTLILSVLESIFFRKMKSIAVSAAREQLIIMERTN